MNTFNVVHWCSSARANLASLFLQSFLAVQIILSALPLLLFVSFSLVTLVVVLVAAIAFSVFWIGAALLILVPTLLAAFFGGLFVWIWAVGTYLFCRFAYRVTSAGRDAVARKQPVQSTVDAVQHKQPLRSTMKAVQDRLPSQSSIEAMQDKLPFQSTMKAVQNKLPQRFNLANGTTTNGATSDQHEEPASQPAPGVPEVVKRSLNEAHESPEAAANPDAVEEKRAVERDIVGHTDPHGDEEVHDEEEPQRNGYPGAGEQAAEPAPPGGFSFAKDGIDNDDDDPASRDAAPANFSFPATGRKQDGAVSDGRYGFDQVHAPSQPDRFGAGMKY